MYQPEGDRIRCLRHNVVFETTAGCGPCAQDPGPAPTEVKEPPAKPPRGCLSTEQIERAMVTEATEIQKLRRELARAKVKDTHVYNSIAKLSDCWAKLMRAAAACATRREDEAIVAAREKHKRETEGGDAH